MPDLTDDDRKFCREWAAAQVPLVTVYESRRGRGKYWFVRNTPDWLDVLVSHPTEDSAWSALAAALAPIRRSFEPVASAGLREELRLVYAAESELLNRRRDLEEEVARLKSRLAELEAAGAKTKDALLQTLDGRCYACGWLFAKDGNGCKPGDCSFRPYASSARDEWLERRKFIYELQASAPPPRTP